MARTPRLIHLVLILLGLALLAFIAWYYTSAYEPVQGIDDRVPAHLSDTPTTPAQAGAQAKIFFTNSNLGSDQDCTKVFPVDRTITDTVNDSPYLELLKGPTADETKLGYASALPAGAKIDSISLKKGTVGNTVIIDFDASLKNVAGSCRVQAIRSQIEATAKAIDPATPTEVIISVQGDAATALQP